LKHIITGSCLQASNSSTDVSMTTCDENNILQMWHWNPGNGI